jgi:hypothetical protein
MDLSTLLTACYDETGYQSSPAAAITTRFTRWLNEGVRAILAEPGLQRLADNDTPLQVASVASTARVVVPESVARILTISERTNDYVLRPMSLQQYRTIEPDPASTTGTPTHYVPIGRVAVATPPSDASEIFIKSTSASDGVGVTAYLEGLITSGYTRTTSTTMNGTTAKSLDTTITTWIEITDWYLSTAAVGTVTLLEDSGAGTELARITIGQKRPGTTRSISGRPRRVRSRTTWTTGGKPWTSPTARMNRRSRPTSIRRSSPTWRCASGSSKTTCNGS